jgi:hypothetical protein
MNAEKVLAGTFLFFLGAATAFAIAYRKEIRLYLKLEKDGTVDAAKSLVDSGQAIFNQFKALTGKA